MLEVSTCLPGKSAISLCASDPAGSAAHEPGYGGATAALGAALYRIFQALARLCLRHGVSYEAAAEIAKRAFVDVARREFVIAGRKQSASRIALLTGIHRKDVGRMLAADRPSDAGGAARVAYAARASSRAGAATRRSGTRAAGPPRSRFDEGSPSLRGPGEAARWRRRARPGRARRAHPGRCR